MEVMDLNEIRASLVAVGGRLPARNAGGWLGGIYGSRPFAVIGDCEEALRGGKKLWTIERSFWGGKNPLARIHPAALLPIKTAV